MRISDWSSDVCSSDLYEKDIAFDYRIVEPDRPQHMEELRAYWPIGKFPLIVDEGVPWFEATIIIEYIDRKAPEPGLIPADPDAALKVRLFDRIFDLHVMAPMQRSEEHTSELQSLMRISYAVFCLKQKKTY